MITSGSPYEKPKINFALDGNITACRLRQREQERKSFEQFREQ